MRFEAENEIIRGKQSIVCKKKLSQDAVWCTTDKT